MDEDDEDFDFTEYLIDDLFTINYPIRAENWNFFAEDTDDTSDESFNYLDVDEDSVLTLDDSSEDQMEEYDFDNDEGIEEVHHMNENVIVNDNDEIIEIVENNTEEGQNEKNDTEICSTPPKHRSQVMGSQSPSSDNCIICLEPWTNSSDHRLVSLNCGHLFGKSCIQKWIHANGSKAKCPQCNAPARQKDIRPLFAKTLRVIDTSERDRAKEELDKERKRRRDIELEMIIQKQKLQNALSENERLKQELMENKLKIEQFCSGNRTTERVISEKTSKNVRSEFFNLLKCIEISPEGGCRTMAYSNILDAIIVSQQISNNRSNLIFGNQSMGWGIKKISMHDLKSSESITIHQKLIKDLSINQYDGTILSCSLDKSLRLTSLFSKSLILSYNLEVEPWSVVFNPNNNNEFFAGLKNGTILMFDTRMTATHAVQFNSVTYSPVVSLSYVNHTNHNGTSIRGVLSSQLDSCAFHQRQSNGTHESNDDMISYDEFSLHPIHCEGRFTSSHFDSKSGHALISCRPSAKHTKCTHMVFNLSIDNRDDEHILNSDIVRTFEGGTSQVQLTKARIFAHPSKENSALICAGDESSKGALIWDMNTNTCIQRLITESPILDLSLMHDIQSDNQFLGALSEKSLHIYKYAA